MSDKVYLSIPVYNAVLQFLNGQPHGNVRGLIDAIEKEVIPQVQAAQAAAQAEQEAVTEAGLSD